MSYALLVDQRHLSLKGENDNDVQPGEQGCEAFLVVRILWMALGETEFAALRFGVLKKRKLLCA